MTATYRATLAWRRLVLRLRARWLRHELHALQRHAEDLRYQLADGQMLLAQLRRQEQRLQLEIGARESGIAALRMAARHPK